MQPIHWASTKALRLRKQDASTVPASCNRLSSGGHNQLRLRSGQQYSLPCFPSTDCISELQRSSKRTVLYASCSSLVICHLPLLCEAKARACSLYHNRDARSGFGLLLLIRKASVINTASMRSPFVWHGVQPWLPVLAVCWVLSQLASV